MNVADEIKLALADLAIPEKAAFFPRFFKSGKGEYAEGDQFIGVTVPDQRKIVKEYWKKIPLEELSELLRSEIHEHRHSALLILVTKFEKASESKDEIIKFYLAHKAYINNWDLVDNSCYKILGRHCFEANDNSVLETLSNEENLWSKRMAIVSTMYHVKRGEFEVMKKLVLKNLNHPHDLMHKANGWLLREMGNISEEELQQFLKAHYRDMPRTTLRYAIEKLDEDTRQNFLKGKI